MLNSGKKFRALRDKKNKYSNSYWGKLGSSNTRTKEQEIKGRDLILQKITETTENTAIAFTDGACLNNPGPCGAGAIVNIFFPCLNHRRMGHEFRFLLPPFFYYPPFIQNFHINHSFFKIFIIIRFFFI
jgi:hypothetical protein